MRNLIPYHRNGFNNPVSRSLFNDDFFVPFFNLGESFGSASFRVDIAEKEDHFEISAELPGVEQEQIDVTVEDGVLTIAANMNSEKKEEQQGYLYSERRSGRFQRSFNLDSNCVKEADISASYQNGILNVIVPKQKNCAEKTQRKIAIN